MSLVSKEASFHENCLSCLLSAMLPVIHTISPDTKRQKAIPSAFMLFMCSVSIHFQFKQAVLNSSGIQMGVDSSVGRHKALLNKLTSTIPFSLPYIPYYVLISSKMNSVMKTSLVKTLSFRQG